jgi:hypothetical protein
MGKEWKKRHRYFRQWTKCERKDIDTSDNVVRSIYVFSFTLCPLSEVSMSFLSPFAHCLKYLCLFFHSAHCLKYLCLFFHTLSIVWSIYVFSFTLCPLSEVSMSFLSHFVHCLKYLCLFFHSLPIVWSIKTKRLQKMRKEWKKRHRYFRQWTKSERKDIDTSDNGQRVKEKT